ncbi:hypothetical protein [Tomitella fengzijianii]|uniref:Uncharacterized protein n=1 Tax=Tomitella fengzijianii TaxID=2597660 RepID=A0A516X0W0_9ACTN|nr:hypothetical protein [Tomitella fengzijianii]QDQ96647.1 hypothetical protein FO059_03930 [Tomitella fengzijianii]
MQAESGTRAATVVVDIGPAGIRAWANGDVTRQRAAVLRTGGGLVYGDEAARGAGADLGAFEGCLAEAVDEEYTALGASVFRTVELFRGLLLHVLTAVGAVGGVLAPGVPRRMVLVLPGQWGAIRRGVVERAAAAVADGVVTVGSSCAAVAAAEAEDSIRRGGAVGVVEQWPGCAVVSVVERASPAHQASVPGRPAGADRLPEHRGAVCLPGVVPGCGGGEGTGAGAGADVGRGLFTALAGLNAGVAPDSVIAVPRSGREFDRTLGAADGARVLFMDGDAPLRGAVLLARAL